MKLKRYISILSFLITFAVNAQESALKASVSKNKLGVNQRLRIEFMISKQGADNFKPPNFKNFKIVGGPSQSVSQSWINGKVTFKKSYTYIIQPKRKGVYNIPPATIEIAGEVVSSNTVKIVVLDAVEIPKNPNDPDYIAQQNIHLVAELSKSQPYVGEAIYVEYRLYFSDKVGIYDNAVTKAPQYNGFWSQEIKRKDTPVKTGKYNGEEYRYAVLHKALLIPTKDGKLTIDPMKMDIVVAVPTGRADFFGNVMTKQVRKEFYSAKKIVNAKSLPLKNKPDDFTGAVGTFDFDVSLNKNSLKANESSQIKVSVSGKGNLKLFELPKVKTPEELETYQPERKENIDVTSNGLKGSVSNTYTLVPEYKGKYKIPKTSFSYFNPKEKSYKTITTNDLFVDVLEGKSLPVVSQANISEKQNMKVTGEDFRYIQTTTNFESSKNHDFFKSILFYILLFLPILAIPVSIFVHKKRQELQDDVIGNKQRKADKLAKKYLSEASNELGNKDAFYQSLQRALHNYLKAKLGIETTDINSEKIASLLKEKQVDNTSITKFIEVLYSCDLARYTPITDVQMKDEYEKAKQVITQLDKQL